MASSPARTSVCLHCRTVLSDDERCDACGGQGVVSLWHAEGRAALLREVWGPAQPAQEADDRRLVRWISTGVMGMGGIAAILPGGGAALGLLAIGIGIAGLFAARGRRFAGPPAGARTPATKAGEDSTMVTVAGQVVSGRALPAPASGSPCIAYSLLLCREGPHRMSEVMLCDAATGGFQIALNDRSLVEVPSGRLRFYSDSPNSPNSPNSRDHEASVSSFDPSFERYLNGLDPYPSRPGLFPYDRVYETLLHLGDRTEILGPLEGLTSPRLVASREEYERMYRDAPRTLWRPTGVPRIRKR